MDLRTPQRDVSRFFPDAAAVLAHAAILVDDLTHRRGAIAAAALLRLRRDLPYCLHPVPGSSEVILVNRDYKPCGRGPGACAKYEEYPAHHILVPPDTLAAVTAPGRRPGYLFHDGCAPWGGSKAASAYSARLDALRAALASS